MDVVEREFPAEPEENVPPRNVAPPARAPDVEAVVSLNGQILVRAAKVANSYYPTWSSAYTDPIVIDDYDAVEIKAIDKDVLFDDHIGVCTSRGMPYVNQEGYASARTFICHGQLWAVALRVSPILR